MRIAEAAGAARAQYRKLSHNMNFFLHIPLCVSVWRALRAAGYLV